MIEVEVKLPVSDPVKILCLLMEEGFQLTGSRVERDTYFDNREGELRASGEALRVREVFDCLDGDAYAQMNYKGKKMDLRTMTRQELEISVYDGETCRQILQSIGFHKVEPEVIKRRRLYQKDDLQVSSFYAGNPEQRTGAVQHKLTVCMDDVEGLGDFLEAEILVKNEADKDAALDKISQFLAKLGYSIEDTIRTSYLTMLQRKQ